MHIKTLTMTLVYYNSKLSNGTRAANTDVSVVSFDRFRLCIKKNRRVVQVFFLDIWPQPIARHFGFRLNISLTSGTFFSSETLLSIFAQGIFPYQEHSCIPPIVVTLFRSASFVFVIHVLHI